MITTPLTGHSLLSHVGLARPFSTRTNRRWAVQLVDTTATNPIHNGGPVASFVIITHGVVSSDIQAHAEDLVGKTYANWPTLPDNPEIFDFAPKDCG